MQMYSKRTHINCNFAPVSRSINKLLDVTAYKPKVPQKSAAYAKHAELLRMLMWAVDFKSFYYPNRLLSEEASEVSPFCRTRNIYML
jgi:hypothetical protein